MTAATVNKSSMNEANERDPFNNNSYGTLVDQGYKLVNLPVLDVNDFNERIIRGYEEGWGERDLPADLTLARSLVPAFLVAADDPLVEVVDVQHRQVDQAVLLVNQRTV